MTESQAKKVIEFRIPADPKYVALVRKGVRSIAEMVAFSEDEARDVEVSVGEAVTNSIIHGRPGSGEGFITARCEFGDWGLCVSIEDQGHTVCVPGVLRPTLFQEHGRGFMLMNALMENVEARCTERGLLVSMRKTRRRCARRRRAHAVT